MPSYMLKRRKLYAVPYVTHAGNPIVDRGVMSGFNSSTFAATTGSFPSGATTFEIVFKFTTAADVTTRQCLYNTGYVIYPCIVSGKFTLALGNGSSWSITSEISGSHSVRANTTYWHRVKFDGAASTLSYSTDGKNWTTDITVASTVCASVGGNFLYIGVVNDKTYPFFGSIDFNECYSNANGARCWTGMSSSKVLPNVTKFGMVMNGATASLWNFANSNYATIPMTFQPKSGDTWELGFKVQIGTIGTQQNILGIVPTERGGVECTISAAGKWALWLSTGTSTNDYIAQGVTGSYTVLAGTVYWVKIIYDGSVYTLSYSLDGETYIEDISVSSTTAIYANGPYCLGANGYPASAGVWTGVIYLPDCYAKINDEVIWKGTKPNAVVDNYALKRRTYLKYAYEDWSQPVATSNTTAVDGGAMEITSTSGDTGSTVNYPWYAMDNTFSDNRFWEVKSVPSWWQVKFPYTIKITGLKYYKGNNDSNNTTFVAFYTSSAMTTQIGNTLSSNGSAWQGFDVSGIPEEGIETDTIYVRLLTSTSNYTSMGELKIEAKKRITVDATKDDYDILGHKNYTLRRSQKFLSNVTKVGNITDVENIIRGFSSSSWVTALDTFSPGANPWEAVVKFKANSIDSYQVLYCSSDIAYQPFDIRIQDKKLAFVGFRENTETRIFTALGTTVLETDKWYWAKGTYSPAIGYSLYLSTDGINYILEDTTYSSITIKQGYNIVLGADFSDNAVYYSGAFSGAIDLKECYINVAGERLWTGVIK